MFNKPPSPVLRLYVPTYPHNPVPGDALPPTAPLPRSLTRTARYPHSPIRPCPWLTCPLSFLVFRSLEGCEAARTAVSSTTAIGTRRPHPLRRHGGLGPPAGGPSSLTSPPSPFHPIPSLTIPSRPRARRSPTHPTPFPATFPQ